MKQNYSSTFIQLPGMLADEAISSLEAVGVIRKATLVERVASPDDGSISISLPDLGINLSLANDDTVHTITIILTVYSLYENDKPFLDGFWPNVSADSTPDHILDVMGPPTQQRPMERLTYEGPWFNYDVGSCIVRFEFDRQLRFRFVMFMIHDWHEKDCGRIA